MDRLIAGYREFRARRWPEQRSLYAALAEGQRPEFLVIACSDSRVDPATIFSARPGELFVVRNVANLVPPFERAGSYHGTSAAIEFAVTALKVRGILVMGHAQCGGVAAALDKSLIPPDTFLAPWVGLLDPAADACRKEGKNAQTALERAAIRLSLERLKTFPFVREAIEARGLALEGARFGIADGKLERLEPKSGRFVEVD